MRAARLWSPWAPADAVRWAAWATVGHVLVVAMWIANMATAPELSRRVGLLTIAVGGFIIVAFADIAWLMRARWGIRSHRTRVLAELFALVHDGEASDADTLVAGPTQNLFHRADCPLARGKRWTAISSAQADDRALLPCGICKP